MEQKRKLTDEEQLKKDPLYITEKEKTAMQIYGGMKPKANLYPEMQKYLESAYGLINAVFFDGIETELTRIVDDKKEISASMIDHSDEMMEMILALYSAMYKYGKTMDENIKAYRVERKESADKMLKRGALISSTSTALYGYDKIAFRKKEMQLMEIYIEKYTPCVDFIKVLGKEYTLSTESEVLIMPGCKVREIEDEEFGEETKSKNVLRVLVSPPDMPEPLTEEEKKEKKELTKVYLDGQIQEDAKRFILILRIMSNTSKEETLKKVNQEEIDAYMKWKTAFITVARYSMREIVLEIEAEIQAKLQGQVQYKASNTLELTQRNLSEINEEIIQDVTESTISNGDNQNQIKSEQQQH